MVLIGRSERFAELRSDRSLAALIKVLFEHEAILVAPVRVSQLADAVVATMASVQSGDVSGFNDALAMLERRKLGPDAEWIHDDLLVFALIVGNLKFKSATELIDQILLARSASTDDRSRMMSQSFDALAHCRDEAPLKAILVVGRVLADPQIKIEGLLLAEAFDQSTKFEIDSGTQQFLRLIGEKVVDLAHHVGAAQNTSDYFQLCRFRKRFETRARIFAGLVFCLILMGTIVGWLFIAKLYFSPNKDEEDLAGKLFQMGIVIGPLAMIFSRRQILAYSRSVFYHMLGGRGLL